MKCLSYDHSSRSNERGFSMLEALFGLILTMIGFSAIFSLQNTQMEASLTARDIGAASNIADQAATVLMRDSYEWTSLFIPGPRLNQPPREWHSLNEFPVDQNMQPHLSDDPNQGTMIRRQRFCVHYWLDPLQGIYDGLMNARIRVLWPRSATDQTSTVRVCGQDNIANYNPETGEWLSLTLPLVLRRHP